MSQWPFASENTQAPAAAADVAANTSAIAANTAAIAGHTTKIGAGTINAYGVQGAKANDLVDAINELAAMMAANCQHGSLRPVPNATTVNTMGMGTPNVLGTATARAMADTNFLSKRARVGYASAGSAGSSSGLLVSIGGPSGWFSRNSGFMFSVTMGLSQLSTNSRWFLGVTANNVSTADPASMVNCFGIGASLGSGNGQVLSNDNSGVCSPVDLTASIPAHTLNSTFNLWAACAPGDSTIYYRARCLDVPAVIAGTASGDILQAAVFPWLAMYANNNADAAAVAVDILGADVWVPFG